MIASTAHISTHENSKESKNGESREGDGCCNTSTHTTYTTGRHTGDQGTAINVERTSSCGMANASDDVTAKRLEVYLTMQRQYAEQLKLSQALSARLDAMASQATLLEEVLVSALGRLGSSRGRLKRKTNPDAAADTVDATEAPFGHSANLRRKTITDTANPQPSPAALDEAAGVDAARSSRCAAAPRAAAVPPAPLPPVWADINSWDRIRRVTSVPPLSPFMTKALMESGSSGGGATAAGHCSAPSPPPTALLSSLSAEPPPLPPSPSLAPSLPAALPSSLHSTATASWSAGSDSLNTGNTPTATVNGPSNCLALAESPTVMDQGLAESVTNGGGGGGGCGNGIVEGARAGPARPAAASCRNEPAAAAEWATTPTLTQAHAEILPYNNLCQQGIVRFQQELVQKLGKLNRRGGAAGGCGGDGNGSSSSTHSVASSGLAADGGKSGRRQRHQHHQQKQRCDLATESALESVRLTATKSAAAPAVVQAAPTSLHSPLVFSPSYFSNPQVLHALQLQGNQRYEVPLVRHLVRQPSGVCTDPRDMDILAGPGVMTPAGSGTSNDARPVDNFGQVMYGTQAGQARQACMYGILPSLPTSAIPGMQVAGSNPGPFATMAAFDSRPSGAAAAAAMPNGGSVVPGICLNLQTLPYSDLPTFAAAAASVDDCGGLLCGSSSAQASTLWQHQALLPTLACHNAAANMNTNLDVQNPVCSPRGPRQNLAVEPPPCVSSSPSMLMSSPSPAPPAPFSPSSLSLIHGPVGYVSAPTVFEGLGLRLRL
ncbi:GON167 protein [Volvox carteri f. nagariensis]|uniref:GON167 protein n=1 Tax=Volvox carteri f. nagariensis TaxID=3068 RepID=D8TZN6_VOLCA|nr:GON167 protein [Volvox carteri f. nagariensis]EFJ46955.1 GON167 protein [Volvox carteri f. nagariensis]|eukprot:XP_002951850.1 GON167 protein [Volvox carteri f. nagariensis]